MKKDCELCQAPARMFCESDRASLCWDCDEKVHGANFLVARHTRILLCHSCQSPTPWKASGSKLGHTISVCETCVKRCTGSSNRINKQIHTDREDDEEEFHDADESDDDTDETDDDDESDDDDDDEVADIQVVPWSSSTAAPPPAAPPPPPIPSCSISESSSSSSTISSRRRLGSTVTLPLKRMRGEKLNHHQDDEIGCSPSPANYKEEEEVASSSSVIFSSSFRPLKDRRLAGDSTSTTLISSLQRFEQKIACSSKEETEESILAICKLSKDPRAI